MTFQDLKEFFVALKIRRLKRKAQKLHNRTGMQYFCVKIKGNIKLISKAHFKWLRQHGVFDKSITAAQLKEISFFYTVKNDKKRT